MITLIVPVYNSKKYLGVCVESVIAQEYKDWEIVLVDDGSTDGSSYICDYLSQKDNRIIVAHTKNNGVSHARNVGLDLANGEQIMFLDSDDYLSPNYLSSFVSHSNADIVVGGYNTFGITKKEISLKEDYFMLKEKYNLIDVGINNPRINAVYHICGKLYKTEIIKAKSLRFPENMKLAEDTCFNILYLQYCRDICFIKESGYYYRMYNIVNKYEFTFKEYYKHVIFFRDCCEKFAINTMYHLTNVNDSILTSFLLSLNNNLSYSSSYKKFVRISKVITSKSLLPTYSSIIKERERMIYYAYKYPNLGFLYIKIDKLIYSSYMHVKKTVCRAMKKNTIKLTHQPLNKV